jgi:hypothetical protein
MTFMVSGGLVVVIYSALAYARRFSAGCGGACTPDGLEFAFVVSLQVLVAALIASLSTKLFAELGYGGLPSHRRDGPGPGRSERDRGAESERER